ncbi:hypothetical protein IG631_11976 [Alternaria alternata]|nr:hypothetical protein IG631_11976 [Alternaria alternata]
MATRSALHLSLLGCAIIAQVLKIEWFVLGKYVSYAVVNSSHVRQLTMNRDKPTHKK